MDGGNKSTRSTMVVITLCATICGAESWTDVERFGWEKYDWFKTFLELENDIPSQRLAALFDISVPDGSGATTCFGRFMGLLELVASCPRLVRLLQLEDMHKTMASMKANGEWPVE